MLHSKTEKGNCQDKAKKSKIKHNESLVANIMISLGKKIASLLGWLGLACWWYLVEHPETHPSRELEK
jgi:hypothetical protein